jgi:RNA polymerase sigma-70 factor (ECF subfamily)
VESTQKAPVSGNFAPTRWTLVLRARGESPEAQKALSELCEAYYQPVFRFLRRGCRDGDTARELTQEFFARLLSRHVLDSAEPGQGRFRSFLLAVVKHFLSDLRDHDRAAKRGGGQAPIPISMGAAGETTTELQIPDPTGPPPDSAFDQDWAATLVDRAVKALASESISSGKHNQFATLKPWLQGEVPSLSQAQAAQQLGISEGAVKVAIHRLRKRFRELVKAEIGQTVGDPLQVQEELRYLIEVLSQA